MGISPSVSRFLLAPSALLAASCWRVLSSALLSSGLEFKGVIGVLPGSAFKKKGGEHLCEGEPFQLVASVANMFTCYSVPVYLLISHCC